MSVVIPVRNDAEVLERCLIALDGQIRVADDVVVVDDHSSDGSAAVAARHRVRVVSVDVAGIPGATAAGFDAAHGEVIARLDADSVAPADWLAHIEADFEADPALAAVSGAARFYGGPPIVRFLGRLSLTVGYFRLVAAVLGHPPLYGSNFAIRADLWRRIRATVHRNRRDVHDDLDLSLQIPPGTVVRYDPGLSVEVSARSFLRPGGTRRQVAMTATTLLATNRDVGLLRLRLAWFVRTPPSATRPHGLLDRLERRERIVAQRIWRPLAQLAAGATEGPGRPSERGAGSTTTP